MEGFKGKRGFKSSYEIEEGLPDDLVYIISLTKTSISYVNRDEEISDGFKCLLEHISKNHSAKLIIKPKESEALDPNISSENIPDEFKVDVAISDQIGEKRESA